MALVPVDCLQLTANILQRDVAHVELQHATEAVDGHPHQVLVLGVVFSDHADKDLQPLTADKDLQLWRSRVSERLADTALDTP